MGNDFAGAKDALVVNLVVIGSISCELTGTIAGACPEGPHLGPWLSCLVPWLRWDNTAGSLDYSCTDLLSWAPHWGLPVRPSEPAQRLSLFANWLSPDLTASLPPRRWR
jgi:hypothetical protein